MPDEIDDILKPPAGVTVSPAAESETPVPITTAPVRRIGKLEEKFTPVYQQWKKADTPDTRRKLLEALDPVIQKGLYSYAPGQESPALRLRAQMLALDAVRSYDPKRGALATHVLTTLRRLNRLAFRSNQVIGLPEKAYIERAKLHTMEKELEDKLGRAPSTAELADYSGFSPKRIQGLRAIKPAIHESALTSVDSSGEVFMPSTQAVASSPEGDLWTLAVYYEQDPINQKIMEHTLGLFGARPLPNQQLAKMLGITPSAVSQRKARIHQMLERPQRIPTYQSEP